MANYPAYTIIEGTHWSEYNQGEIPQDHGGRINSTGSAQSQLKGVNQEITKESICDKYHVDSFELHYDM